VDVLSDVISAMRVGRPECARVEWRAPWGQRFPDQPGTAGFIVVLSGSCWLIRESGDPVWLGPGDVVFSPYGDGYALADSPATPLADPSKEGTGGASASAGVGPSAVTLCGGYHLDPHWSHPLLRELPGTIHVPARLGRYSGVRAAVEILGAEVDGDRMGADVLLPIALDLLLTNILRTWFEDGLQETGGGWAAALADPATRAALNAVHNSPGHPWTVQELADVARLSRATFSRRFGALTGRPPLTYLTWWRMTIAANLLRDPAISVGAVAAQVGYSSEFAFAHAFKRHFDIAPGSFRRQRTASAGKR
jgi:AraC-like DNA-binding protein